MLPQGGVKFRRAAVRTSKRNPWSDLPDSDDPSTREPYLLPFPPKTRGKIETQDSAQHDEI